MSQPVRYGVVGAGMMGVEHIENIAALDGAVVSAISDPDPGSQTKALEACRNDSQSGEVAVFDHHDELIRSGLCDAVVLASPNMTHAEVLGDLLDSDLHILVEKPLCITVPDCRSVVRAAHNRNALLWVGLEYRYMPAVAELARRVAAGAVGQVHMVAIREHRFPFLEKVGNWNRFNRNTGGTLVEKCCHFFDLMNLFVASTPLQVYASGAQSVNHLQERYDGEVPDILDNAYVVVDYENGARAMLDLCMFAEATHNQEEIAVVGDSGKIEAYIPEDIVRVGYRGEHSIGAVETVKVVNDIAYQGLHHGSSFVEHQRFLNAIRTGSAAEVAPIHGLRSVAMGVAAQHSIAENRPVSISEISEPADWQD